MKAAAGDESTVVVAATRAMSFMRVSADNHYCQELSADAYAIQKIDLLRNL